MLNLVHINWHISTEYWHISTENLLADLHMQDISQLMKHV